MVVEYWAEALLKYPRWRAKAYPSAENFVMAYLLAIRQQNYVALQALLKEWSQEFYEEPGQQVAVLLDLKAQLQSLIIQEATPENAVVLLQENETTFAPALVHLTNLEAREYAAHVRNALETVHHKTQRLDKHKSDFISVASHELKTPLTLIEGYANMLKTDHPEQDYPRTAAVIKGILGGTQRLREIIEDMIDVSMLDMEMLELNLQPVWIPRLLDMVTTEMNKMAEKRHISVAFDSEGFSTEAIEGDPERLFQVFVKLIENGIKYTPDGGHIQISARQDDTWVQISVKDNGIGLDPTDFDVIFEKFYSLGQVGLHSSSKTKFKGGGPGLGLAIARGIVEAHGGHIWVESRGYNEQSRWGSSFNVQLPAKVINGFEAIAKPADELAQKNVG
jgi:signal transduction histidine kinase